MATAKNTKYKKIGTAMTSPVENTTRKEVFIKVPKTENIIFIGSENYYDSFWLKMMFAVIDKGIPLLLQMTK